jgi:hypothetical protein
LPDTSEMIVRRQAQDSSNRLLNIAAVVTQTVPPTDRAFTELHVRYGVRNNLYFDWSITLRARHGDVEEFMQSKDHLERRILEIVDVSESAIRRHVFDPYEPHKLPQTTVLVPLQAGDGAVVDMQYQMQMNGLAERWAQKQGAAASPHTSSTFAFAEKNHDSEFRNGTFSWVRNTLISLSTDLAQAVIAERSGWYFPQKPSTAGVLMPDAEMKFIKIGPGGKLAPSEVGAFLGDASDEGPMKASGDVTMGMLVDSIYASGWTDGVDDLPEAGIAPTSGPAAWSSGRGVRLNCAARQRRARGEAPTYAKPISGCRQGSVKLQATAKGADQ